MTTFIKKSTCWNFSSIRFFKKQPENNYFKFQENYFSENIKWINIDVFSGFTHIATLAD